LPPVRSKVEIGERGAHYYDLLLSVQRLIKEGKIDQLRMEISKTEAEPATVKKNTPSSRTDYPTES
jgi:hypothetical protein